MAIRRNCIQWILLKFLFFCVILLFLNTLVKWTPWWNPTVLKTCEPQNEQQLMGRRTWTLTTKICGYNAGKLSTSKGMTQNRRTIISKRQPDNLGIMTKDIHGLHCPANPHKETTLKYLLNYWAALQSYYDLSSFLCGPLFSGLYGAL